MVFQEVSASSVRAIWLLIYLTGTPSWKRDISVSWRFVCVCAEYHLWLESGPDQHFLGKLYPPLSCEFLIFSNVFFSKVFSGCSLQIDCQVIETCCEPNTLPWYSCSYVYPVCRQTFWAGLEKRPCIPGTSWGTEAEDTRTLAWKNIIANWDALHETSWVPRNHLPALLSCFLDAIETCAPNTGSSNRR